MHPNQPIDNQEEENTQSIREIYREAIVHNQPYLSMIIQILLEANLLTLDNTTKRLLALLSLEKVRDYIQAQNSYKDYMDRLLSEPPDTRD